MRGFLLGNRAGRHAAIGAALLVALLFSAAMIGLAGCSPEGDENSGTRYRNAVYIYMCGSTLETKSSIASKSIEAMLEARIADGTAVVIETGGTRKWRGHNIPSDALARYEVRGGRLVELERLDDASMGDPRTLSSFLAFCQQNYSAENTTLVLWNHGAGSIGGVCLDETHGMDGLSTAELDEALDSTDSHFSNICFDACLMAGYETMRVVANHADTMIASEEIEPSLGWDYKALVESLGSDRFAEDVLASYEKLCEINGKHLYTLSAVDLSRFPQVEAAFETFCRDVLEGKAQAGQLQSVAQAAIDAMGFGGSEGKYDLVDLAQFSEKLDFDLLGRTIADCVQTVNGSDRQGASGVSIFFPISGEAALQEYLASETSDSYALFLGSGFASESAGAESITFADEGSVSGTNLAFSVSDSTASGVRSVVYDIYQLNGNEPANCLGFDSDLAKTGKGGYTISFSGNWVALNGHLLCCEPIDIVGNTTVFSSPVKLNGSTGDLRFTYSKKDRAFSLLGFVAQEDNGAQGRLEDIVEGDEITVLSEQFESNGGLDTHYIETETIEVAGNLELSAVTLPDGLYQIYGLVTDLYGNEYATRNFIVRLEDGSVVEAECR